MRHRRPFVFGAVIVAVLAAAVLAAARPAPVAGTVRVQSIEYPRSPETVAIGERFPVAVILEYSGLQNADLSIHFAYTDHPPTFQTGGTVRLSGSGTYRFPPCDVIVPIESSMPGGWPKLSNEWRLSADIWQGGQKLGGRAFTVLVENPKYKPSFAITGYDFVAPPDTIAVNEATLIKIHVKYLNFEPNTKIKVVLWENAQTQLLTRDSKPLHGNGTLTFGLTITPKQPGRWVIQTNLMTASGSTGLLETGQIIMEVVRTP